ncbi:hypothetical protein [Jeongeupia chitinilytica]|uniref:Transmembrane protein n=1 Tax=Jeongeupia chitinilytica TaxID=1041641 RepID=A0ABQ3H7A7_9NEIS|nr:hypothetical protein [Jeongeupia chitinilytica]GHD68489.1 hypothetical protein GCM10007350_33910 [Jeongeupia chitinilytica]
MKFLDSFPKKMCALFFGLAVLMPFVSYFTPRIDYSCGDGSCMAAGLFSSYVVYILTALSYYLAAVFFLRTSLATYWRSALLAIPVVLLISPRGYFNFF